MILAQAVFPFRLQCDDFFANYRPNVQLHSMALAIVKTDGLHTREALKRPSEANGRILPSRKKHQRGLSLAHAHAKSLLTLGEDLVEEQSLASGFLHHAVGT